MIALCPVRRFIIDMTPRRNTAGRRPRRARLSGASAAQRAEMQAELVVSTGGARSEEDPEPKEATGDDVDRIKRGPDAGRRVRAARRCDRGARNPRPGSVQWQAAPARRHSACALRSGTPLT